MRKPRVLLAEDDAAFRSILADALRGWGMLVEELTTGGDLARALFGETAGELPDLIVTDIRMPGPSGMSALRCLRIEAWATPVILVTAFPDKALVREAESLGAVVLAKPFPLESLERLVRVAMRP